MRFAADLARQLLNIDENDIRKEIYNKCVNNPKLLTKEPGFNYSLVDYNDEIIIPENQSKNISSIRKISKDLFAINNEIYISFVFNKELLPKICCGDFKKISLQKQYLKIYFEFAID